MGRLTVRGATSQRDINRLLELSNDNQFGRNEAYYKLQHYEDLEEQLMESAEIDIDSMVGEFMHYYNLQKENRLIELPCAVGDTVWDIIRDEARGYGAIREKIVDGIEYRIDGFYIYANEDEWLGKFGELVFLTKEAAEAKLRELERE